MSTDSRARSLDWPPPAVRASACSDGTASAAGSCTPCPTGLLRAGRVAAVGQAIQTLTGVTLGLAGAGAALFSFAGAANRYAEIESRLRPLYEAQTDVNRAMQDAIGLEAKHRHLLRLRDYWVDRVRDVPGLEIMLPDEPGRYGAVTGFRLPGMRGPDAAKKAAKKSVKKAAKKKR